MQTFDTRDAAERLRLAGIPITLQRLAISQILLTHPIHLSADQVLERVQQNMPEVSRATVYNTLKLFSQKGLVKELLVDKERAVFDSNTTEHYHFYDMDTGEVKDVPAGAMKVVGAPLLPPGMELEEVAVVIKVRSRAGSRPLGQAETERDTQIA